MFTRYAGIGVGHSCAATMEPEEDEDEEPIDYSDDELPPSNVQPSIDDDIDEDETGETDDIQGGAEDSMQLGELDVEAMDLGPEDGEADWSGIRVEDEEGFGQL